MDMKELSSILQQNGIVGAGGAGFPTYAKLDERAETIILNCAECEPYITADYRTMIETPEKLVGGMKIILRLFDNEIPLKFRNKTRIHMDGVSTMLVAECTDFPGQNIA